MRRRRLEKDQRGALEGIVRIVSADRHTPGRSAESGEDVVQEGGGEGEPA